MNTEDRFHRLVASFYSVAAATPAGTVYRPSAPISLADALGRGAGQRRVRDRLDPLIEFTQEPDAGGAVEFGVLPIGRAGGLLYLRGGGSRTTQLIAAAVSRDPATLLSAWLPALLAHNGADYGVELLHRLPPVIRCYRPELLRRNSVKRALWRWLEWADDAGICRWSELRRHVLHRWGRDEWGAVLSHEDRRSLLRIYFAVSYIERVPSDVGTRDANDVVSRWIP